MRIVGQPQGQGDHSLGVANLPHVVQTATFPAIRAQVSWGLLFEAVERGATSDGVGAPEEQRPLDDIVPSLIHGSAVPRCCRKDLLGSVRRLTARNIRVLVDVRVIMAMMSLERGRRSLLRTYLYAVTAALMIAMALPAHAQVSKNEIVRGLKPSEGVTRGLSRSLGGQTRKIEIVPGKEAEILDQNKDLPKINLTIEFEYNSDRPTPVGERQLVALGEALKDASLNQFRFMLAGHTDARGSDDYNQQLSERRAIAVQRHLLSNRIEPARLSVVGFGKKRLLDAGKPESPRNRRVEIVNLLN